MAEYLATVAVDRTQPCKLDGCSSPIGKRGNNGMCRKHARQTQRARRPNHYLAKVSARRSLMRRQTPPWADMTAIERIYETCPTGHEVDHIVALCQMENGVHTACGMHVDHNLRHLPMIENRKKGPRPIRAHILALAPR